MDLAITPEQWPSCISNTASLWHCDLSGGLQSQEKCFPLVCLGRSCCSQSSVKITIIVVSSDCRSIISSPLFLNVYQSSFQFKWFFECRFHGSRSACISEELDALVFFSILSQGEGKRKCLLNENCWRRVDYDAYLFCTAIHLCWINLNENGVTSAFVTDVKRLLLSAVPLLLYMFVTLSFHPRVLARFLYEKCIRQLKSTPGFYAFLSCPFFHFTFPNNSSLPTAHQCLVLLQ